MGKSQRVKGAGYEREVANEFRRAGFEARRGVRQTQDAAGESDVPVEGLPIWIEAKRGGPGARPHPALAQALLVCGEAIPVFVGRPDRQPSIVSMYLSDYLDFLRKVFPEAASALKLEDIDGEE